MSRATASILALLCAVAVFLLLTRPPHHRVFINGQVITVNNNNDIFEAVSVRGKYIEAVGSNDDIRELIGNKTRITDLKGQTLIPGFIDAHSHYPSSGLSAVSVDLSPPPIGHTRSIKDIRQALGTELQNTDADKWLLGFGYDDSSLDEQRHPLRSELDTISREQPIYLWHSSGHMGVTNSPGLSKLGIDKNTPSVPGGVIGRNPKSGELNGLLQEKAALPLSELTGEFSLLDYYHILQRANRDYARNGITTAQSGAANFELLRTLAWASRLGMIPFRIAIFPRHTVLSSQEANKKSTLKKYNSDRFHIGPVKLFADGSPQGYTAFLSQPYFRPPPGGKPDYRGFPAVDQAVLVKQISELHNAGYQLAVHGNGDAAIENIIDAFSIAQENHHNDDPRAIVVHAQMARQDQLLRMRELGMTPSFFTTHTYYWGDVHMNRTMGPERAANISPANSAQRLGLRFSLHSDAPVTPINPLQLIWSAVNRQSVDGTEIGLHERISVTQALRAVTIDAAWQIFQEKNRGSIEVGKFADLVILSGDLLNNDDDLRNLTVTETLVGGETVYDSAEK